MNAYFSHPFTFVVHVLLLGVGLLFIHQGCINYIFYRAARQRSYFYYATLAFLSGLNCLVTFLPILSFSQHTKILLFHLMWSIGMLVFYVYIEAIKRYLDLPGKRLRITKNVFLVLSIIPWIAGVQYELTGKTFFYDLVPSTSQSILFQAVGNPFSHNAITMVFGTATSFFATLVVLAFANDIMRRQRKDYYLLAGLGVTLLGVIFEIMMSGGSWRYTMPLLVFANLVEVLRITYISTIKMGSQINHLKEVSEEQKEIIEQQLNELERSEKLSVLGEITSGISHEIINPLQTIRGYLELTELKLADHAFNHEAVRDYLARSNLAVDHINSIVSVINSFAVMEQKNPFSVISLNDVIENARSLSYFKLKKHDVKISLTLPSQPLFLNCHLTELTQVLMNLINNACDAVDGLPDKRIYIEALSTGERVHIRITDSGSGLDHEVKRNLGKPFFTTKNVGKGQGLGLYISTRIVERHHGRLFFDESCSNTRFVIDLPQAEGQAVKTMMN